MHIGSATLGIPGSGVLGGYDKSRVLGDVSAQPFTNTKLPINLLDISLGVESGGSPWSTGNVTGLFANGNSSLRSGLTVNAEPIDPYIYLPKSTCKAIAAQLPVTYRSDLSLYTWNTDDSMYRKIVTSPSYLAFTFVKDNTNTMNITIKVPFALLNLTLEEPLVSSPTAYFLCMGADTQFSLGRAFLQSAFIGVNWKSSEKSWFLAQAPGPGVGLPDIVTLDDDSGSLPAVSLSSWESSWSNHWTKLTPNGSESVSNSTASDETTQAGDDGGLSTGAKAGIGIGCAAVGLVAIMVAAWCFIRRRKQLVDKPANGHVVSQTAYNNQLSLVPVGASSDFSGQSYSGTTAESFPQELDAGRKRTGPYELS